MTYSHYNKVITILQTLRLNGITAAQIKILSYQQSIYRSTVTIIKIKTIHHSHINNDVHYHKFLKQ